MVLDDKGTSERLGEEVGRELVSGTVVKGNGAVFGDFVANPELVSGDVFHARLVDRVVENLDGGQVVCVEGRWRGEGVTDFA